MPQFSSTRLDPYKNFKFKVMWDSRFVAGLSKMSAIKRTTEAIEWREAGDPALVRKLPGRTKSEPVTLERGLSHDDQFIEWANLVSNPITGPDISLSKYRKEVTIQVLNEAGTPAIAYILKRAWVSEFQAVPEMDANANAVGIQMLKLEYEGFIVDPNVSEPAET